jgi:2-oxoglutarate dehydrogenase complex dehydrogenase (E1) component-like enzyme
MFGFIGGGSVHVIVNNQIGYTTQSMNARSTIYSSDIAKMINAPVIHVNADFPEVCVFQKKEYTKVLI